MQSIFIVMHQKKPNVIELAETVARAFTEAGICVFGEKWLYDLLIKEGRNCFSGYSLEDCEMIVSVGGDGTLLRAHALAYPLGLPVLGVNVGTVGFLTEIELNQLPDACSYLKRDEYALSSRMVLQVSVGDRHCWALNDIVVSRGGYSRLIGVDAWVNDASIGCFRADGLIISTPTGSTGYSLSAGGPIICPEVECIMLTPICPHSLQHRPIVTSDKARITVRLNDDVPATLSIDGHQSFPFCTNDVLTVVKAECPASFVRLEQKNFFSKIRVKLSEWSR